MPDRAPPHLPIDPDDSGMSTHMDIISFSPVVPYEGIPHAGGAYVLVHMQALVAAGHHVTLVAPDSAVNRSARVGLDSVTVELVGPEPGSRPDARARLRPALPARSWERAVTRSARVRELVAAADLIEYQWTQTAHLQRTLARSGPIAPAICVAHDVVSQLAGREASREGIGGLERVVRAARARVVRADERAILRRMTATLTFSPKDADLLSHSMGVAGVQVVAPPLEPVDARWALPRRPVAGRVVFVGAFDREENADAADWMLSHIWPTVRAGVPGATLHFVGANPTHSMLRAAAEGPVVAAGYVEDLVPAYLEASVVVVPLRLGAGVKFKTVTALLWGVPVVSTAVGVEGIAPVDSPVFGAVTDDPTRFAAAVIDLLSGDATTLASAAREYATERYGLEAFFARIDATYSAAAARRIAQ